MSTHRLPGGGLIDRSRPVAFTFDDRPYAGFAGDTLASALLAAGVKRVGRSFKYHRSRGILTAGSEEPNALVELRTGARREANTRATVAELFEGLEAHSQNRWPSLALDVGALNSIATPLIGAGFYYKTFMWPRSWWEKIYEPAIRRAAGLGTASNEPDPDSYDKAYLHCDVLVIGAGPAGLSAALTAARAGVRVVLCEEDFLLGGRLNGERHRIEGLTGPEWVARVRAELESHALVRIFARTTVFGVYDGGAGRAGGVATRTFGAVERVSDHLPVPAPHQPRQRLWKIVARRAVLAAGAIERPLVFGNNDRPGVMLASAVRTYVNRFAVTPGRRVAVFTSSDDGWRTASDLVAAGVPVAALIDAREQIDPGLQAAAGAVERVFTGAQVIDTRGSARLRKIVLRERSGRMHALPADTLAVSGGWSANLALATHLGGRPRWSEERLSFVPEGSPAGLHVAGAARGVFPLGGCLSDGVAAGRDAVSELGLPPPAMPQWSVDDERSQVSPLWFVTGSRGKAFVDFQHDVTTEDVGLAVREGFRSVELVKRYTTLGMATDQGKTSNLNGHALAAALTGRSIAQAGTTTFRPPYTPVSIGAFAGTHRGKHFEPTRRTAGHTWARERRATFIESGEWLRAQWFALPQEKSWLETVIREVRAVRSGVGVCDVSTLGKIDVQGRDAAAFLDRIYTSVFSTLPISKTRYGLMLREDGFVLDDGTTARLADDHYVMSTTTANAGRVMRHLEYARQVLWPALDVQLASVSEQWAQFAIAGPSSRRVLEQLLHGALDVSNEAFPYLACAEFQWRGVAARLFRISFSGELAYELAVPSDRGDAAVRAIMEAGASHDITPYGLESLGVMRIEKGHVAGAELNGTTTAGDLGLGRLLSARKDFIGRTLAARPALTDPSRPALVGIRPLESGSRLHAGAHLLIPTDPVALERDQGYVTSAAYSPTLGHWIALALLIRGRERLGERLRVYDPIRGNDLAAEVVSPVFYDPDGARLHG